LNDFNRFVHLDEGIRLEAASNPSCTVDSNVFHDAEHLQPNNENYAVIKNSNRAVTAVARSDINDVGQHTSHAQLPLVDEAARTSGNITTDGISLLHRNSAAVPVLHANVIKLVMTPELQLLPPTAFMSRNDGTPILNTESSCGPVSSASLYRQHEKRMKGGGDGLDTRVPCGLKTKYAEDDTTSDVGGQSESDAAELLYIRQTLRTFTDNKDKLKYVIFSPLMLINVKNLPV